MLSVEFPHENNQVAEPHRDGTPFLASLSPLAPLTLPLAVRSRVRARVSLSLSLPAEIDHQRFIKDAYGEMEEEEPLTVQFEPLEQMPETRKPPAPASLRTVPLGG